MNSITTNVADNITFNIKEPSNFIDLEAITLEMVRKILQHWLEISEGIAPNPQTRCSGCGKFANYVSKRVGFMRSQFGLLRYRRAYYVCPHCHQSTCPMDERLDPVESLARLRVKVADGNQLPVADIAKEWGLGSLNIVPSFLSTEIDQVNVGTGRIKTNQLQNSSGSHFQGASHCGAIS
jgi:hypothetical protein